MKSKELIDFGGLHVDTIYLPDEQVIVRFHTRNAEAVSALTAVGGAEELRRIAVGVVHSHRHMPRHTMLISKADKSAHLAARFEGGLGGLVIDVGLYGIPFLECSFKTRDSDDQAVRRWGDGRDLTHLVVQAIACLWVRIQAPETELEEGATSMIEALPDGKQICLIFLGMEGGTPTFGVFVHVPVSEQSEAEEAA